MAGFGVLEKILGIVGVMLAEYNELSVGSKTGFSSTAFPRR